MLSSKASATRTDTNVKIHPTADVDQGAAIGAGTTIWNWTKVREGASIGSGVSIGQHVYVDTNVQIGDRCKIQNTVNIFDGVVVGSDVFIGPSATFTNDRHPRAVGEWQVSHTVVEDRASIGANATIVCGVTLGAGCMVGAGSVVTKDVAPGVLVVGNPARPIGNAPPPKRVRRVGDES
ncbi:MAG: N-acetyltransferase [Acidimicrobiales bacterium]|nr:N-acetyltransferase [Acidimicrobiales bacterium]